MDVVAVDAPGDIATGTVGVDNNAVGVISICRKLPQSPVCYIVVIDVDFICRNIRITGAYLYAPAMIASRVVININI
jgi:hypothetical protein